MAVLINPLAFNPAGPFNWLHGYLMATWARVIYIVNAAADEAILQTIMGADDFITLEGEDVGQLGSVILKAHVALGPWGTATMLRGTNTLTPQLLAEVLGSTLVDSGPIWTGKIAQYFKLSAELTGAGLSPWVEEPWLSAGHSLGGAVAGLVGQGGSWPLPAAARVFTMGAPREGNYYYATSRTAATRLRWENHGDLTPLIPFIGSVNPFDDGLILPSGQVSLFGSYVAWGIHHHLWDDGSLTLPPAVIRETGEDFGEFLIETVLNADFLAKHYAPEYAKRVRQGIPLAFPLSIPNLAFPGLFELDAINSGLNANDGFTWVIDGDPFRRPAVLIGPKEPLDFQSFACE